MPQPKLFVSYRRINSAFTYWLAEELNKLLLVELFVDYLGIDEPDFESSLLRNLRESDAVLLIVTDDTFSMSRIHHDMDWVRLEIREALILNKPIVLVCQNGVFPPADLPDDIQAIRKVQGIEIYTNYFKAGVQRLAAFLDKATPIKLKQPISIRPVPSPNETLVDHVSSLRAILDEAISLHEGGHYDRAIELYQRLIQEQYQTRLISISDFRNRAVAERDAEQRHWEAGQIYDEIATLFRIDRERGVQEYTRFLTNYPEFTDDPVGLKQKSTASRIIPMTPTESGLYTLYKLSGNAIVDTYPTKLPKVHDEQINSLAFSGDSSLLASGGNGRDKQNLILWNITENKEVAILEGHTDDVKSVAFSPNGILASGGQDKSIRLWDIFEEREVGKLKMGFFGIKSSNINSVAFNSNGYYLASGVGNHTISLWDVYEQRQLSVLKGHTDNVRSVVFSPGGMSGMVLASGSNDKTVRLWMVLPQQTADIGILVGHADIVNNVAFSPNGQLIFSGSDDETVRLWSVSSHSQLAVLKGHKGSVRSVAFSPNGQFIASGSDDETVRLWSVSSHSQLAVLKGHKGSVRSIAFSPDGKILASAGDDQIIYLWHIE